MSKEKFVMRVRSDNFSGYMTIEAYEEFRLQLSTGDYHTHEHAFWPIESLIPSQREEILTLSDIEKE